MIQFVFFGSCIGSVLTAALLHWMYQGAFAKWERKALAEIARLRLTDEERDAVAALISFAEGAGVVHLHDKQLAAARRLLERHKEGER